MTAADDAVGVESFEKTPPTQDEAQLALFLNARDVEANGTAPWPKLPIDAHFSYLTDARAILGAVAVLGYVKPTDPADLEARRLDALAFLFASYDLPSEIVDKRHFLRDQTLGEAIVAAVVGIS